MRWWKPSPSCRLALNDMVKVGMGVVSKVFFRCFRVRLRSKGRDLGFQMQKTYDSYEDIYQG